MPARGPLSPGPTHALSVVEVVAVVSTVEVEVVVVLDVVVVLVASRHGH
jgi:hypothetical protein